MLKNFCINFDNSIKCFLSNLTKCLNRANTEVELPNNYKEVFIIMEKIDFTIIMEI